ncbi:hypothetical protein ETD86_51700 [Nonomuraea turkmeniaca]|uniref:Uncharacterized protein n=1 Tax=Nonomuraea turkmeniaca TaxID=103838 RepID=A0A5S4EVG1_9ACTN|nr:hypothetical protein [Nonomuraea turkmeniaca]TMR07381.1 hypothetical protein ETD86_51700 [Nonomuraea turkmeniaca]
MVRAALRVLGFELKGLASIGLWIVRRRHGVPAGAIAVTYAKEQAFTLWLMLFAMAVETVVVDLLLVATGVPDWIRFTVLIADVYGLLFGVMLAAASCTRPHVVTADEVRIRYAAYFDVRVPRDRIAAVRVSRNDNESQMVSVKDGRLRVAVASRTNVTIELTEPVAFVRPLGSRAEASVISFFADDPKALANALASMEGTSV